LRVTAVASPAARVRRARSLVAFWDGDDLVVENYVTGRRAAVSPPVLSLLDELDRERDTDDPVIDELLERDLVVVDGSPAADLEDRLAREWRWGHDARFLHFATQDLEFECRPETQRRALAGRAVDDPPPAPTKCLGTTAIELGPSAPLAGTLENALRARRTCRAYTGAPIARDVFAAVLRATWGSTHRVLDPELGEHILKTSPSGGARHPIEVYPIVLAVEGVEPGIYHYAVGEDRLELVRPGRLHDEIVTLGCGQDWLRDAAAVFVMTAVVARSMWKYASSHAYRVLHLDAGHVGQTFHLVCTALGLGPFTTAATRNRALEQALDVDGIGEIVLYTAAAGVPAAS
jgi:SagB-type dehydrogenase family enzyme